MLLSINSFWYRSYIIKYGHVICNVTVAKRDNKVMPQKSKRSQNSVFICHMKLYCPHVQSPLAEVKSIQKRLSDYIENIEVSLNVISSIMVQESDGAVCYFSWHKNPDGESDEPLCTYLNIGWNWKSLIIVKLQSNRNPDMCRGKYFIILLRFI